MIQLFNMLITDLPTETLDLIASSLESPVELTHLSVTCSRLHLIVSPNHTQFRIIRIPLISPLWKELYNNRSLAQNVRVLEIQSAEPYSRQIDVPRIPGMYKKPCCRTGSCVPLYVRLKEWLVSSCFNGTVPHPS